MLRPFDAAPHIVVTPTIELHFCCFITVILLCYESFFLLLLLVFRDRVSLYSPGCTGTNFVDQAGLELRNRLPLPPE